MKCEVCGRKLTDNQKVVLVGKVVENEKRGDFVTQANNYAHIYHFNRL